MLGSYENARQIKTKQDGYCSKAIAGEWKGLGGLPRRFEMGGPRGRFEGKSQGESRILHGSSVPFKTLIQVQTHCYEAVDLDAFVRVRVVVPSSRTCEHDPRLSCPTNFNFRLPLSIMPTKLILFQTSSNGPMASYLLR
jgi:hypothetical protein